MTPRAQAVEFYNRAVAEAFPAGDLTMAYRLLSSATVVDPTCGQALVTLASACADLKMLPAAVACYQRALALPDDDTPGGMNPALRTRALVDLGHRLYHSGRIAEAHRIIFATLHDHPEEAFAWSNLSMVESVLGDEDRAIASARKGFDLLDQNPADTPEWRKYHAMTEMSLAFALLFAGRFQEGLKHFEARFRYSLTAYEHYPYPRWDGGHVGTLLVVAEQGAGDTLCYSRFFDLARQRCDRMVVYAQRELIPLFAPRWPDIQFIFLEERFPVADAWTPVVSLPLALGLDDAAIAAAPWPEFTPSAPIPAAQWRSPTASLHVGIAWKGSEANEIDRWRSLRFEDFLAYLAPIPGVQLYSLQVGTGASDLHQCGGAGLVRDLAPYVRHAGDTIALMRDLDLVVSVESFPAWLAAAADVPAVVPYSYNGGDYRMSRATRPVVWAPRTTPVRQTSPTAWAECWERVAQRVKDAMP